MIMIMIMIMIIMIIIIIIKSYAPFIVFNRMVLSEGHSNKCLKNKQRRARREFETILCRSKNPNWARIQWPVAPQFPKLH